MKELVLILIFIIAGTISADAHPVHVSVCSIEFSQKESIISIKLYKDDFGTVIQNKYNEEFVLSKSEENPYRDYIINYVNSNLQLLVKNNKPLKFTFDYSEIDEVSIWLYFRINKVIHADSLRIINTLMLDLYEDQTNLLIINHQGKQDGFRFTYQNRQLDIGLR